jgi:hypothetical protein
MEARMGTAGRRRWKSSINRSAWIAHRTVRRQSFWDKERFKLRESLARLVCNVMRLADGAASGGWRLSVV